MPAGNGTAYGQIAAPERTLRGKYVRILVPRSHEMQALKPVVDRLSADLPVREVLELDTRSRVSATSAKMHAKGIGREHDVLRSVLFLLEDTWLRLNALAGLLADKESAVLELHAIGKEGGKDAFGRQADFRRLLGTQVMLRNELWIEEYYEPIRNSLDVLAKWNGRGEYLAAFFEGLDIRAIARSRDDMLGTLSESLGRTAMLGIPSESKRAKAPKGTKPRTEFEKNVLCHDYVPSNPGAEEMLAIFALFHEKRIATPRIEEISHNL